MMDTSWIRVEPTKATRTMREKIRGVDVSVQISPYDIPLAFRGIYLEEQGAFRIEFKYEDGEPSGGREKVDQMVTVELGKVSRKLLAIEVAVDEHGIDVVRFKVPALDQADQAVKRLMQQATTTPPSARLNYRAVDEVLRENRSNPRLLQTV